MKKILLIILLCLFGTVYGQTIGYMRYDTVKIFTTKPGGRGSLDVTGNVKFTGLLPKSAGTDSVVVRDVNGNLGTTAKTALVTTPTWQQTLTAGSTLTGANTIIGGGFPFIWNNALSWEVYGTDDIVLGTTNGGLGNYQFGALTGGVIMSAASVALGGHGSDINVQPDTIFINPYLGHLKIDTLQNAVGTKSLRYNPTTGLVTYADTTTTGSSGITVGTTTIASGTNTNILYNNSGTLGEYTVTGTGTVVVKQASPTVTGILTITGPNTAVFPLDITNNVNGVSGFRVTNTSNGAAAQIQNQLVNDAGSLAYYGASSSNFTGFVPLNSGTAFFGGTMPVSIFTQNAQPIIFSTNSTLQSVLSSGGAWQWNSYGAGTLTSDASGNITSVSDTRLKNVQGYSGTGLKQVLKLQPIDYKWNKSSGNEMLHTYTGFSAQNVKENIPNGTGIMPDGYLTLQDRAIMAAMVNAIKELNDKVELLEKEVKRLKK